MSLGWRVATSLSPALTPIELAATGVTIPQNIDEQFYVILRRILRDRQNPNDGLKLAEHSLPSAFRNTSIPHNSSHNMSKARKRRPNSLLRTPER